MDDLERGLLLGAFEPGGPTRPTGMVPASLKDFLDPLSWLGP
jgi:hypothetical protein